MNSPFKFLRRVRILGGESGAVARALHHEAKIQSLPAVDENVSFTTNERKSMSTKTSLLKRIAQTAVVALAGGILSTLALPSANAASNSSISATCVARGNYGGVLNVTVNGGDDFILYAAQSAATLSTESATSSVSLSSRVVSTRPDSGSTSTGLPLAADSVTTKYATITYLVWLDNTGNGDNTSTPGTVAANGVAADPYTTVVCTLAGAPTQFSLSATSASVAATESSTFTITPQDSSGRSTLLAPGETITVSSSLTTALAVPGKAILDGNGNRTGRYAAGGNLPQTSNGTSVASNLVVLHETSTPVNDIGGNVANQQNGQCTVGSTSAPCTIQLGPENADGVSTGESDSPNVTGNNDTITATGAFTVNVTNTAAATTTWTVRGAGTLQFISATASTFTLTTVSYVYGACFGVGSKAALGEIGGTAVAGGGIIDGNQTAPANNPDASGTASECKTAGSTTGPQVAGDSYTVSTANKSVSIKWQLTAAGTMQATVAAVSTTSSTPAGITLETVNLNSGTDTHVSLTLTATAPVSGQSYKVTWQSATNVSRTLTLTYADPVVNSTNGNVVLTPTSGKALTGGTVATTATVRDQFYSLVNGATVLFSVSGRNATTSGVAKTTGASGTASYSFVDDGAPATTLSDSVSATAQTTGAATSASATARTFTWTASLDVSSLRLVNSSSSASGDAVNTAITFTATALNASGAALDGYPVTFTGDANTYYDANSNSVVVYTNSSGVATAVFYGKKVSTATVTATSGGKTATATMGILAGTARTISVNAATASMAAGASKRVTVTVADEYGNGIEDASITVTYAGTAGRVASVNGIASATGTADAAGAVVIEVASDAAAATGTGTLTVKFTGGNTSTAALNGDGSTKPARVTSATTAVTITKADSSATDAATAAAEAASDAAAEAIDAANAATDAANLAAEAADAATVAAEEARDAADAATAAVEELATQVATLMAALKAQITTLANTVAKIAKKVKA